MDITGKGSLDALVNLAGERATRLHAEVAPDRTSHKLNETDPERERVELEKAAVQFEGVFMNTLLKAMRNTVPENELFNGGGATKFYRQMHDAEIAKSLATSNGGMGIADMIVRQLSLKESTGELNPGQAGPVQGPSAPRALERYRNLAPAGPEISSRKRLAMLAASQGAAVADTLQRFRPEIENAAENSGLDPALLLAVVMEESGGDPAARSSRGALGLMQLMPATAQELGVHNSTNPAQNLHGGARYLADMLEKFSGQLDVALAAYNAGPGTVDRNGGNIPDYPETRQYVKRVMERFHQLGGGTPLASED